MFPVLLAVVPLGSVGPCGCEAPVNVRILMGLHVPVDV